MTTCLHTGPQQQQQQRSHDCISCSSLPSLRVLLCRGRAATAAAAAEMMRQNVVAVCYWILIFPQLPSNQSPAAASIDWTLPVRVPTTRRLATGPPSPPLHPLPICTVITGPSYTQRAAVVAAATSAAGDQIHASAAGCLSLKHPSRLFPLLVRSAARC